MRTVGVVTAARSDYGIYRPVLQKLRAHPDLQPCLFVTGMHLSPEFGATWEDIVRDGFEIHQRIEMLLSSDRPGGMAKSMGLGTIGFAQAFERSPPDVLLVLGDRFEMHAAAVAALPLCIPIAHIHGGESTQGNLDEAFRHALTKMSHLHFAACDEYKRRLIQMGEEPWRVTVSGAPGLDNLRDFEPMSREDLAAHLGFDVRADTLLVTYHPVTLEQRRTAQHMAELLAALERVAKPVLFTYPNADTTSRTIIDSIRAFCSGRSDRHLAVHLGTRGYLSAMAHCSAMVGNSSSGIIEAASLRLPVVNVGIRQRGRLRPPNVIDSVTRREAIAEAIAEACSRRFGKGLADLVNPYGDGRAAERIVRVLAAVKLDDRLRIKTFYDLTAVELLTEQERLRCG